MTLLTNPTPTVLTNLWTGVDSLGCPDSKKKVAVLKSNSNICRTFLSSRPYERYRDKGIELEIDR